MGWYFGFKLQLVCNDKEESIDFMFTEANLNDRFPIKQKKFHNKLFRKFFSDKGLTKIRKKMKKNNYKNYK